VPQSALSTCKSTQRSGVRQYESPTVGHAHEPPEHTVPGFNEQSAASRHSTHLFLGVSQIGVGVMQSVFDMQPPGLPLLVEVDDELPPIPPAPPPLDPVLLDDDKLDSVPVTSGRGMMS
jgi:hypothetical protein